MPCFPMWTFVSVQRLHLFSKNENVQKKTNVRLDDQNYPSVGFEKGRPLFSHRSKAIGNGFSLGDSPGRPLFLNKITSGEITHRHGKVTIFPGKYHQIQPAMLVYRNVCEKILMDFGRLSIPIRILIDFWLKSLRMVDETSMPELRLDMRPPKYSQPKQGTLFEKAKIIPSCQPHLHPLISVCGALLKKMLS